MCRTARPSEEGGRLADQKLVSAAKSSFLIPSSSSSTMSKPGEESEGRRGEGRRRKETLLPLNA